MTAPNNEKEGVKSIIVSSFPDDLGTSKNPIPYMLIKIFETQEGTLETPSDDPTSSSIRQGFSRVANLVETAAGGSETVAGGIVGGVVGGVRGAVAGAAVGLFSNFAMGVANNTLNNVFNTVGVDYVSAAKNSIKSFSLKRNQEMLSSTLALYMPDGMTASYDQDYEGISVTQALGTLGFLAQAAGSAKAGAPATKVDASNPFVAEGTSAVASKLLGSDISKLMTFATTGRVVNPQIELLYTSPTLRKFTFDFRLVPKNKREAEILFGKINKTGNEQDNPRINLVDLGIINLLKYYSAPRIVDNAGGRYFIPPAQFMIEFWYNDAGNPKVNSNLFRTKRCVLESVNVDYSPNGYVTHYDGAPVEVRMQLSFQETVMLDREAIKAGY